LTATVPTRHPERPRPVPSVIRVYARALRIGEPTAQRWQQLGIGLTQGDEPMDRLLEWMRTTGTAHTRTLFDQALRDGIDAVADAPAPLREFFTLVETAPDWVDWASVRRGQRALRASGADGAYLARDVALLGGYQFSGFNKTLIRTGALEKGSNQRFAETFRWALDVISEDGLAPNAVGYQSTLRVRLIHAFVRSHVAAMPDWQREEWGLPVNQTDMAATLLGTFIAPTAAGIGIGILQTRREADDIAHFTRYVGWLMGVQEQWLPVSFRDGFRGLYHSLAALSEPDESSRQLAAPMAEDPSRWNYDHVAPLRRRIARAQHLSLASAYLGPRTMRSLGLPTHTFPWYPAVRLPVNAARSIAAVALPGGRDRAARRGWRQQERFMQTVTARAASIGESSVAIVETRDRPVHRMPVDQQQAAVVDVSDSVAASVQQVPPSSAGPKVSASASTV